MSRQTVDNKNEDLIKLIKDMKFLTILGLIETGTDADVRAYVENFDLDVEYSRLEKKRKGLEARRLDIIDGMIKYEGSPEEKANLVFEEFSTTIENRRYLQITIILTLHHMIELYQRTGGKVSPDGEEFLQHLFNKTHGIIGPIPTIYELIPFYANDLATIDQYGLQSYMNGTVTNDDTLYIYEPTKRLPSDNLDIYIHVISVMNTLMDANFRKSNAGEVNIASVNRVRKMTKYSILSAFLALGAYMFSGKCQYIYSDAYNNRKSYNWLVDNKLLASGINSYIGTKHFDIPLIGRHNIPSMVSIPGKDIDLGYFNKLLDIGDVDILNVLSTMKYTEDLGVDFKTLSKELGVSM